MICARERGKRERECVCVCALNNNNNNLCGSDKERHELKTRFGPHRRR